MSHWRKSERQKVPERPVLSTTLPRASASLGVETLDRQETLTPAYTPVSESFPTGILFPWAEPTVTLTFPVSEAPNYHPVTLRTLTLPHINFRILGNNFPPEPLNLWPFVPSPIKWKTSISIFSRMWTTPLNSIGNPFMVSICLHMLCLKVNNVCLTVGRVFMQWRPGCDS